MENMESSLLQHYELGKFIGSGNFAKVRLAKNLKNGEIMAVKIVDKEKVYKAGLMDQIKREISAMRTVKHPSIVHLHEVLASKTKIYFVMEYVTGGELFDKVAKGGKLKENVARRYFQQLMSAVDFCHHRGVYHRDLKPENILLDNNGNLKVLDFGLCALSESRRHDGLLHTTCGTPAYVAPEVINRKGYDGAKVDIWSCGVILFVLLAGYLPFNDSNLMEMYRRIVKAEFKCPNWISSEARKLISKMLDPNPKTRISIAKIMENSWFRKGLDLKAKLTESKESKVDTDAVLENQDLEKVKTLNAFDIISFSPGFDLSGLFVENDRKIEERFTSRHPAKMIIAKLYDIAQNLKLKVMNKGGFLRLERPQLGRKGALSIDAEILEVTPTFHFVEIKKSSGDTIEYQRMMKQEIRPALKDIVWTWQGDQPQTELQDEQLIT